MRISGVVQVPLRVGKRKLEAEILISPDFEGLISGYDWLYQQGSFEWDVPRARIRLGAGNWVLMWNDEPLVQVRQIIAMEDVTIPAREQVTAAARMLHNAWSCLSAQPRYGVMESQPVSTVEHVYSGRILLSMPTTVLQVPLLNSRDREIVIQKGTLLGKVFAADSVVTPTATRSHVNRI